MSEDTFIREVDEEMRQDQIRGLWSRFGNIVIGVAILIVVGVAAWRGWEYWSNLQAGKSGDTYLAAVELSEQGRGDAAIEALTPLLSGGHGEYPALARLRIAGEKANKGDPEAALADYEAIAADGSVSDPLRQVARLRAGLIAVDREGYDQVRPKLEPLAAAGAPYRSIAREALGLSAWKAGEMQEAARWFRQIADDAGETGSVRDRANLMLDLLAGKGATGQG